MNHIGCIQIDELVMIRIGEFGSAENDREKLRLVIAKLCRIFDIPEEVLKSKTRKREVVELRQIIMSIACKSTQLSLASIGLELGGKDHATVLHAKKVVDNLNETDKIFRAKYQLIKQSIRFIL